MWVGLLIAACWRPTETGPNGMVGRMLDAEGRGVAGIDVSSLEEHVTTDSTGAFAVQYKPPEQFVSWAYGAAWIRRTYREEDRGKVIDVRLPALRDVALSCEVEPVAGASGAPCARVQLTWDLGGGLFAKADLPCDRSPKQVVGLPVGAPTAACAVPVRLVESGDRWVVRPPPTPLRVEIRADEGPLPASCVVRVGDRLASPMEGGFFTAEASGRVQVGGACDSRPLFPRFADAEAGSVALDWSPVGPLLDLAGLPTPAGPLRLIREADGVTLVVEPEPDGSFRLPPLPEGRYRVGIGDTAALATMAPPALVAPGAVRLLAQVPATAAGPGGMAGVLVLDAELEEGKLPVVLAIP